MHAEILCQSDKFKATVQGEWKESAERKIALEDWDAETVGRMVDWLYNEDYPAPCPREEQTRSESPEIVQQDDPWPPPPRSRKAKKTRNLSRHLEGQPTDNSEIQEKGRVHPLLPLSHMSYGETSLHLRDLRNESFQAWASKKTRSTHTLDYADVLITHAKVYVLAGYILLPALQSFAFTHVKEVLVFVGPIVSGTQLVPNLVAFIRYVYANTNGLANSQDPLRELITTYVALNLAGFAGEEADHLEEEGGDFVRELCDKIKQHTAYLEATLLTANQAIERWEAEKKAGEIPGLALVRNRGGPFG